MELPFNARHTLGQMKLSQGFTREDVAKYQELDRAIKVASIFNHCKLQDDDIELFVKMVQK